MKKFKSHPPSLSQTLASYIVHILTGMYRSADITQISTTPSFPALSDSGTSLALMLHLARVLIPSSDMCLVCSIRDKLLLLAPLWTAAAACGPGRIGDLQIGRSCDLPISCSLSIPPVLPPFLILLLSYDPSLCPPVSFFLPSPLLSTFLFFFSLPPSCVCL